MTGRLLILVTVLIAGSLAVWVGERRRGSTTETAPVGLTLVTGEGCRLCPLARRALGDVPHRVIDVSQSGGLEIRSLPTLLMIGADGEIEWRRSGRSAIAQAARLAQVGA